MSHDNWWVTVHAADVSTIWTSTCPIPWTHPGQALAALDVTKGNVLGMDIKAKFCLLYVRRGIGKSNLLAKVSGVGHGGCVANMENFNMRELTAIEVEQIDGAGKGGDIAMTLAAGWASAVTGVGVGLVVGGPVGGIAGGLIGFTVGAGAGIGYILAR